MKKLIAFAFAVLLIVGISSCKKCMTCTVTYQGVTGEKTDVSEECGSSSDLDAFESAQQSKAEKLGGDVECVTE